MMTQAMEYEKQDVAEQQLESAQNRSSTARGLEREIEKVRGRISN